MEDISLAGLALIIINIIVSYRGLRDDAFMDRYAFEVDKILTGKDYKRLVTAGFLHVSWLHLGMNMIALYSFSQMVELRLGTPEFLALYFASMVGGNLFLLYIRRHNSSYSSVGASGAICGIIFASVALFRGMKLGLIGIPIHIPAWAFGLIYTLISIYGIRSQSTNVAHEAHLGGGLVGLFIALGYEPFAIRDNYLPILCILAPSIIFIYIVVKRPEFLLLGHLSKGRNTLYTMEDRYNSRKINQEQELNQILDKIARHGIESLSKNERKKLDEYSK